jgi:hypothetical protein
VQRDAALAAETVTADLIANGGEEPPGLRRDPRQLIPGAPAVAA